MIKFSVKKLGSAAGVVEWLSWDPDGDGYVEIRKFDTREQAQTAGAEWSPSNFTVVEVTLPQSSQ